MQGPAGHAAVPLGAGVPRADYRPVLGVPSPPHTYWASCALVSGLQGQGWHVLRLVKAVPKPRGRWVSVRGGLGVPLPPRGPPICVCLWAGWPGSSGETTRVQPRSVREGWAPSGSVSGRLRTCVSTPATSWPGAASSLSEFDALEASLTDSAPRACVSV